MLMKKKEASGAMGYVMMFIFAILLVTISLYLAQMARLMTHQHHIDDSLADSVLASLVVDDVYYFETYEMTGTPVVRFRNVNESYSVYKDCMQDAIADAAGFYYNVEYAQFICYEVEGSNVRITEYSGNAGIKNISSRALGTVKTPDGETVTETSAYAKVDFDIKSVMSDDMIRKSKDIYCTLEINN